MSSQDVNVVTMTGRLVADPELKHVGEQKLPLMTFDLACNGQKEVGFFQVKMWNDRAEKLSSILKKGSRIIVVGRMNQEKWKTKDDETRSTVTVVASNIEFLKTEKPKVATAEGDASETPGTDIPFA